MGEADERRPLLASMRGLAATVLIGRLVADGSLALLALVECGDDRGTSGARRRSARHARSETTAVMISSQQGA